jgi:ribonuclease HI
LNQESENARPPEPANLRTFGPTNRFVAYIDGGARGNPGPAGFGVRIERPDGTLVEEFSEAIGVATNNVAEYRGLLAALEWARAHRAAALHVRSDSQLLVQQMLGRYKVKHPGLQLLHGRARLLAHEIGRVTYEHIERARNAAADRLANEAMDAASDESAPGLRHAAPRTSHPAPSTSNAAPRSSHVAPRTPPHPFSDLERAVRLFIYRHFLDTTRAPDLDAIARETRSADADAAAALRRLADARAIVLAPASLAIWMAHPFSAVPTAYPVTTNGRTYWANCAWDAAGVLSLVGTDGESRTTCADCGEPVTMTVEGRRMIGDGVVHYAVPPRRFWENVAYT